MMSRTRHVRNVKRRRNGKIMIRSGPLLKYGYMFAIGPV
jgi:hypothetical protein